VTIVFLTVYPFNEDYCLKYGFRTFQEKGFEIVILNIFTLIYNTDIEKQAGYVEFQPVSGVEQVRVKSGRDFSNRLRAIGDRKIAILVASLRFNVLWHLKKANVDYLLHYLNLHPTGQKINRTALERYSAIVKLILASPKQFMEKIKFKGRQLIPYTLIGMDNPRYVICAGSTANVRYPLAEAQKIYTHSFDYDQYLQNKNIVRDVSIPDTPYLVFLSCSMWDVHDYLLCNVEPVITKEQYEEVIVRAFDYIEKKIGKKIVIAAGPKASESENVYNGRSYSRFNTEQLVKYSDGVLCHYSGAISFAVIHEKPICFTTIRRLDNDKYFTKFVTAYAEELGADIHYIDSERDLELLVREGCFSYRSDKYSEYKKKYLCSTDSGDIRCWEKVSEVLKTDYFGQ